MWNLQGPINSGYLAHCSHFFFTSIRIVFLVFYMYATSESYDTNFAGRVVYELLVLSVLSVTLVLIAAILIPAVDYSFCCISL